MMMTITLIQIAFVVLVGVAIMKFRIWKPKRMVYFVAAYALLGFAAFGYVITASSDMLKAVSHDDMKQIQVENALLSKRLQMRDYRALNDIKQQFSMTVEPTKEDVTINRVQELGRLQTIIEWTDAETNEITVNYYQSPIYQKRIELSTFVEPPEIVFDNNTLYIRDKESNINMKSLNMKIEMIDENRWSYQTDGFAGNRILYLNVPKHFNIIDSGGW